MSFLFNNSKKQAYDMSLVVRNSASLSRESKKLKKPASHDIFDSTDSGSESDSKLCTVTVDRKPSAKTQTPPKRMQNKESGGTTSKSDLSVEGTSKVRSNKIVVRKSEEILFKITLRRSTDQSMYKIQRQPPATPAKKSTPKRTRSNSSEISTPSTPTSRSGNHSRREVEPIHEKPDEGNTIGTPQRSSRSRRPPQKLASYEYSPLPSSSHYEDSPKSSARLRTRQRINYNESNLELNSDVNNTTPRRAGKEHAPVTRSRGGQTPTAGKKEISDAATISTPNLRKRNLRNIQQPEKEAGSDTDSSSVSPATTLRTRLSSLRKRGVTVEATNANKENMPSTSKQMDFTPSKVTRSRKGSIRQNEDTSKPVIGRALLPSPKTNKRVASKKIEEVYLVSDESEVNSDSSTVSRTSWIDTRAEHRLRPRILEDSIEGCSNRMPQKKIAKGGKSIASDENEVDSDDSTLSTDSLKAMLAECERRSKAAGDTVKRSTNKNPSQTIVIAETSIDSDESEVDSDGSTLSTDSLKALMAECERRGKMAEETMQSGTNKIPPKKMAIGAKSIDSDENEVDSDSSALSTESLEPMKADSRLRPRQKPRPKILEAPAEGWVDTTDKIPSTKGKSTPQRKNVPLKADDILTPGPSDNKKYNTRKRAAPASANKHSSNLEMEIAKGDTSLSDAGSEEEPHEKVKKSLKKAEKKKAVARSAEASPEQTPKKSHANKDSVAKSPKLLTAQKYKCLTPSIGKRCSAALKPVTPLQNARARLHVGAVPKSLPCREEEFNTVFSFLKGKLLDKTGGCIYICGVPGTGKTATVNEVVRCLEKLAKGGELEDFNFVAINALELTEPQQAYVKILKKLGGETHKWSQAQKLLEHRFKRHLSKMTILLVDEFDHLCIRNQQVVYNILSWPTEKTANLVVVTIANRMDLPEKMLMPRVASRLGYTRLTFQPYNHQQLLQIVEGRLKDSNSFRSEAIQLIARKVSAISGDARRALDICRRAAEITESRSASSISIDDATRAIYEMIASPKVRAIQSCSELEKLFLLSVTAEMEGSSVEEVTFNRVFAQMQCLCSFEGVRRTNVSETLAICDRLAASRILICSKSPIDIQQKIRLNVSADDIHYAMKQNQD